MKNTNPSLHFGDIIVINYPYTDLSGYKKRPCLVLKEDREDVLVCFLSSQTSKKETHDLFIKKSGENNLKNNSLLKTTKINIVHREMCSQRIGQVSSSDKTVIKSTLVEMIKAL